MMNTLNKFSGKEINALYEENIFNLANINNINRATYFQPAPNTPLNGPLIM